jgi:hypothetical protein
MDKDGPDYLDGWKEISNYLGKSVRTVQRWEEERGLPIRRVPGKAGDAISASRAEIDKWRQSRRRKPTGVQFLVILVAAAAVVAAAYLWIAGRHAVEPLTFEVAPPNLNAYGPGRRLVWSKPFSDLAMDPYEHPYLQLPPRIQRADLDGDSKSEVLFLQLGRLNVNALYAYSNVGRDLFVHEVAARVRLGTVEIGPPFPIMQFITTPEEGGTRSVWLVAQHTQTGAAVVRKLAPAGNVLGEYWSMGHVFVLADTRIGRKRYMLVGATHHSPEGASLAALDYDDPSGSGVSDDPEYRCGSCPPGRPLAFHVFPPTELPRLFGQRAYVTEVKPEPNGDLMVAVTQSQPTTFAGTQLDRTAVFYRLGANLHVLSVEVGDRYREAHAHLRLLKALDHDFGARDLQQLWPVKSWDGARLVAVRPTGRAGAQ